MAAKAEKIVIFVSLAISKMRVEMTFVMLV